MIPDLPELIRTVECLEDYEEASAALIEIKQRTPAICANLAFHILDKALGDRYLQAFAFGMLYSTDRNRAFSWMRQHASNCDAYVFGSILTSIGIDAGLLEEVPELSEMVRMLRHVIAARTSDPSADRERWKEGLGWFERGYREKAS